jgi:outer membrane lipoprotein-sorting protein
VRAEKAGPGNALRVVLDPGSVGENLDSLIVTLTPAAEAVRRVETQDPAGNRVEYEITSLRYDARPGRGAFTFRIPAGVEVVDMR